MEQTYAHDDSSVYDELFLTMVMLNDDIPERDPFGEGGPSIILRDERYCNCHRWLEEQIFLRRFDFTPEYDEFSKQQFETLRGSREAELKET